MSKKRKTTTASAPKSNQNLIIPAIIVSIGLVLSVIIGVTLGNNPSTSGGGNNVIGQYERYLAENPDDVNARISLGHAYFEKGMSMIGQTNQAGSNIQFLSAIQNYEKVIEKMPDNVEILGNIATSYYYTGRVDDAITTVERVLELSPKFYPARFNYAIYLGYGQGNYLQAVDELKKIDTSAPNYANAQSMIEEFTNLATQSMDKFEIEVNRN